MCIHEHAKGNGCVAVAFARAVLCSGIQNFSHAFDHFQASQIIFYVGILGNGNGFIFQSCFELWHGFPVPFFRNHHFGNVFRSIFLSGKFCHGRTIAAGVQACPGKLHIIRNKAKNLFLRSVGTVSDFQDKGGFQIAVFFFKCEPYNGKVTASPEVLPDEAGAFRNCGEIWIDMFIEPALGVEPVFFLFPVHKIVSRVYPVYDRDIVMHAAFNEVGSQEGAV